MQQPYPRQQYPTKEQYTQPPVIVPPRPQVFVQEQQNVVRSIKWENYNSKSSVVLGVIQISIAVICIIANSVAFHLQRIRADFVDYEENEAFYVLTGLWASVFFILTGSFAIVAARFKTSCWIVTTMVFAIISCLFAFALLGTMAGAVGIENSEYRTQEKNKCPYSTKFFGCYIRRAGTSLDKASLALGAIMLILSMVEIVVSLWTSAICCASVCCGRRARAQMMSGGEAVHLASNPSAGQGQYTQPPVIVQPQPVFVQAQQNVVRSKKWENYKSKSSVVLGVIQISIAVICIIANSVAFHLQRIREDFTDDFQAENEAFYVLTGLWASFFFILTGSFAIVAARSKTSCWIVTTMVFAIISCLFAFALLGTMAGAVGIENSEYFTYDENKCPSYTSYMDFGCYIRRAGTSLDKASLAFGAIMLILSIVEIVVSIWTSAICCASVCCGRRARAQMMSGGEAVHLASNPPAGQVMYVNQGAPVYPAQGQEDMHMYQPPQYPGPAMYQQPGQQYPTTPADHGPPNTAVDPDQPPAYGEVEKM